MLSGVETCTTPVLQPNLFCIFVHVQTNRRMQLFYLPGISLPDLFATGNTLTEMPDEESVHISRVLRMKPGDALKVTDGKGAIALASVENPGKKVCTIQLRELQVKEKKPFRLHIAVAPTKNIARFEWFLEKATEFGIDRVTPLFCDHSERQKLRTDRLEKVVIAAMKQSFNCFLPVISEPVEFDTLIATGSPNGNRFIAWVDDNPRPHLKDACEKGKDTMVLIGPEGDFSQREITLALSKGFGPVSLGSNTLRTETAALASCFIVNLLNEPG